jgi:two-component sensor histidine kinase/PAS domain-containing protein
MSKTMKVLFVGENLDHYNLVTTLLKRDNKDKYIIFRHQSLEKNPKLSINTIYDVIILDIDRHKDGSHNLSKLGSQIKKIPIVIVTQNNNEKFQLECLDDGVQDCLLIDELDETKLKKSIKFAIQRNNSFLDSQPLKHIYYSTKEHESIIGHINRIKDQYTSNNLSDETEYNYTNSSSLNKINTVFGTNKDVEKDFSTENKYLQIENEVDGIYQTNLNGDILFVNNAMVDILKYEDLKDLKTKNVLDLYKNPYKRNLILEKIKTSGSFNDFELEMITKTGTPIKMLINANLSGNIIHGTVREISKPGFAEKLLAESKNKYKTLYNSINEGLALHKIIYNEKGVVKNYIILDVNPAYEEILGITREKVVGKLATEVYGTEKPPYIEIYGLIAESGRPSNFDTYFEPMDKHFRISAFSCKKGFFATAFEDISDRKKREINIETSLNEKETLLREIHHRVKNNMQIVSSLLNLQSRYVDEDETINVLKESQNRVRTMAIIHENLYQSNDLNSIKLADYIPRLVKELFYTFNISKSRIKKIIDIEDIKLNIETSIPCGLIINELVSNSLKYAFPNNITGKLMVSIRTNEDGYELIIEDDGVGFPNHINYKNTDSLGLQLVNNLTTQIDGIIELDKSNGTKFIINF